MHRYPQTVGTVLVFTAVVLSAKSGGAQVAVAPWFIGRGTYGTGVVDDFLIEISIAVQVEQKPVRQPAPAQPAAARSDQSRAANGSYTDNPGKWGQVYLHMRQGENSFSLQDRPRRLTPSEFDPVMGKIRWPQVLLDAKYAMLRDRIEELFVLRAKTSPTPKIATEIHDAVVETIDTLRGDIETLPANDYVATRKFLDSLDFSVVAPSTPKSFSPGE